MRGTPYQRKSLSDHCCRREHVFVAIPENFQNISPKRLSKFSVFFRENTRTKPKYDRQHLNILPKVNQKFSVQRIGRRSFPGRLSTATQEETFRYIRLETLLLQEEGCPSRRRRLILTQNVVHNVIVNIR